MSLGMTTVGKFKSLGDVYEGFWKGRGGGGRGIWSGGALVGSFYRRERGGRGGEVPEMAGGGYGEDCSVLV